MIQLAHDAAIQDILVRLSRIEEKVEAVRATYIGHGKVLVRSKIHDMIYIVDGSERVFVPRFIADGVYEPDVTAFFTQNLTQHSCCIDVGANFGYYTCLMGRFSPHGRHIGVEAQKSTFDFLKTNVFANWIESTVTPVHAAVSDALVR